MLETAISAVRLRDAKTESGRIMADVTAKYLEKRWLVDSRRTMDSVPMPKIKIAQQFIGINNFDTPFVRFVANNAEHRMIDKIELDYRHDENAWFIRRNGGEYLFLCTFGQFYEYENAEVDKNTVTIVNKAANQVLETITDCETLSIAGCL
jgi:hypothetical protein